MTPSGNKRWRTAWRWTGIGFFFAGFLSLCAVAAFWMDFRDFYGYDPYRTVHRVYLYPREWVDVFLYGGLALLLAGCMAFGLMQRFPVQMREASQPCYVSPQTKRPQIPLDENAPAMSSTRRLLEQFFENAGFDGEEEPLDAITKVICVHCRKEYDWDYPKCPHCGAVNDVLLRKRRE